MVAGWLTDDANTLAAHFVLVTIVNLLSAIGLGCESAAAVGIAIAQGRGDVRIMKRVLWQSIFSSVLWCLPILGGTYVCQEFVVAAFTSNPERIQKIRSLLPLCLVYSLFCAVGQTTGGDLRGLGMPVRATLTYVFGYYIVMFPALWLMASVFHLQLVSVWLCNMIGEFTVMALGLAMLSAVDVKAILEQFKSDDVTDGCMDSDLGDMVCMTNTSKSYDFQSDTIDLCQIAMELESKNSSNVGSQDEQKPESKTAKCFCLTLTAMFRSC